MNNIYIYIYIWSLIAPRPVHRTHLLEFEQQTFLCRSLYIYIYKTKVW